MTLACRLSLATLVLVCPVLAAPELPPALAAMIDTERAFARTAAEKGIRDSFLDYFAPDAVAFTPSPVPARERLLKQKPRPFADVELTWEPRAGDVAASGDLGWLTGPSTFVDHTGDPAPHYGNYLSVWRRQADGSWRVYIDVGADQPTPTPFPDGFTRVSPPSRYAGADAAGAAATLLEEDRALNSGLATDPAAAYAARVEAASRLHRPGVPTPVGPEAIARWLRANGRGTAAEAQGAEASKAGDFGYSHGSYTVAGSPEHGAYVRIWARDAAGRWRLMADVLQPLAR